MQRDRKNKTEKKNKRERERESKKIRLIELYDFNFDIKYAKYNKEIKQKCQKTNQRN